MVKPGGTGRPRLHISARLAPLPPSRFMSPARPSAAPSPKVKTHLVMLCSPVAGDWKDGETESSTRVRLWSDMMLQCERQAPAKPFCRYNRLRKSSAQTCGKKTCHLTVG